MLIKRAIGHALAIDWMQGGFWWRGWYREKVHVSAHPDGKRDDKTGEFGHLQKERLPSMRRLATCT
jgi:hypothetical protein